MGRQIQRNSCVRVNVAEILMMIIILILDHHVYKAAIRLCLYI